MCMREALALALVLLMGTAALCRAGELTPMADAESFAARRGITISATSPLVHWFGRVVYATTGLSVAFDYGGAEVRLQVTGATYIDVVLHDMNSGSRLQIRYSCGGGSSCCPPCYDPECCGVQRERRRLWRISNNQGHTSIHSSGGSAAGRGVRRVACQGVRGRSAVWHVHRPQLADRVWLCRKSWRVASANGAPVCALRVHW
jgi:hypothetical protein